MTIKRVTNDDLANSLDQIWAEVADRGAENQALHARLTKMEGHLLRLTVTNERLLKERQTLLEAIAFQRLHDVGVRLRATPEAPATADPSEFFDKDDLKRILRELQ